MPKGSAAEYAKYACNFYVGCSNACTYCFNKRWGWGDVPTLKKCFKDENHALDVFKRELEANMGELQEHGLFFSFTSDLFLKETISLNVAAIDMCVNSWIPVKALTKRADWIDKHNYNQRFYNFPYYIKPDYDDELRLSKTADNMLAIGFSLTGRDDLEPFASTNAERIKAMRKLHAAGFKVWCSVEPIIDFSSSTRMMLECQDFCDHYKVGLQSGKQYDKDDVSDFIWNLINADRFTLRDLPLSEHKYKEFNSKLKYKKIYFKDNILKKAGIRREELPANCVDRNFKIWEL